ncbi:MAG: hypothetical protein FJY11_01725 [Bacteroidetes bacterium]|nr:hypothetical protein [Bacteroidota bacterium]
MNRWQKYDRIFTGILAGVVIPLVVMTGFYLWKSDGMSAGEFFDRLVISGALTNALSVSVFANVFAFLLFNRLDILRASRGILGTTIVWAILVFIIKFS